MLAYIAENGRLMPVSGQFQALEENCTVSQVEVVRGISNSPDIEQSTFFINDDSDFIMVRV